MKKYKLIILIALTGFLISGKMAISREIGRVETAPNGKYFQNPVLGGDYPDPSVLRVGFMMTFQVGSWDYNGSSSNNI